MNDSQNASNGKLTQRNTTQAAIERVILNRDLRTAYGWRVRVR